MACLLKKKFFRTDGQTNGRTHKRTDGRSNYFMPQILFGGIKRSKFYLSYIIIYAFFLSKLFEIEILSRIDHRFNLNKECLDTSIAISI